MTIQDVLTQVRHKRVCYAAEGAFTIPLKWQKSNMREGRAVAYIPEEHAAMLAAASGKDHTNTRVLKLGMTIPNHDDYLGIGKNFLSLLHRGQGKYMVQLDRYDHKNPMPLPKYFDLSSRLRPPESPETRPGEMIPEDFYS